MMCTTLGHLGIHAHFSPNFPNKRQEETRLETFKNWTSTAVNPQTLVKAGFFYIGEEDKVRCFHCGGGLSDWQEGDDPIIDHKLYFPWCTFIQNKPDVIQNTN